MREEVKLEVLSPRSEIRPPKAAQLSPGVADLHGKRVALVDNTKPGSALLLTSVGEVLKRRFPDIKIKLWTKVGYADDEVELYKKVAEESDAVVFALGD